MADLQDDQADQRALESQGTGDERMSIARYLATRLSTLKPPMNKAPNPFSTLGLLNRQQWLFVTVSFLGLTQPSKYISATYLPAADRLSRLDLGCIRFLHAFVDDH